MKTQMTDRARDLLARYEADVRRSLARRTDLDPEDVVAGIREHVDAALSGGSADAIAPPEATQATVEAVADALERLGPPSSWAAADTGPLPAGVTGVADRRAAILPAFGLIVLGGILVFTPRWGALGWGLLIAGTLVLRVTGLREGSPAEETPGGPDSGVADRLALAWWWLAASFGAVVVLAAPAVLAWGAAQTGGALVQPLSSLIEASAATRTGGSLAGRSGTYWLATAAVAGLASGTWWVFVGLVLRRWGYLVRRALGPARKLSGPRIPRALVFGGAFLCGAALLSALPLLGWMPS